MSDQPTRVVGRPFPKGSPGRPKGYRNKLGEVFASAMLRDFEEHGPATIVLARMEDPLGYIKVVAGMLPKEVTGEDGEALFSGIQVTFVKTEPK